MPTIKKKKLKRREDVSALSEYQLEYLLYGECLLDPGPDDLTFEDADIFTVKKAWQRNKKYLLSLAGKTRPEYERTYYDVGQRPFGFYKFDLRDEKLYWDFGWASMHGDRLSEFNFLKKNGYLQADEEQKFFKFLENLKKIEEERKKLLKDVKIDD